VDNVLPFVSRADKTRITDPVYECTCGSQEFYLRPPAQIVCRGCEETHPHLMWSQLFLSKNWCPS